MICVLMRSWRIVHYLWVKDKRSCAGGGSDLERAVGRSFSALLSGGRNTRLPQCERGRNKGADCNKGSAEFDKNVGKGLKLIAAKHGQNMGYSIRKFGHELQPKDFAHQIKKVEEGSVMVNKTVSEAKATMTGPTRSSYQKLKDLLLCRQLCVPVARPR